MEVIRTSSTLDKMGGIDSKHRHFNDNLITNQFLSIPISYSFLPFRYHWVEHNDHTIVKRNGQRVPQFHFNSSSDIITNERWQNVDRILWQLTNKYISSLFFLLFLQASAQHEYFVYQNALISANQSIMSIHYYSMWLWSEWVYVYVCTFKYTSDCHFHTFLLTFLWPSLAQTSWLHRLLSRKVQQKHEHIIFMDNVGYSQFPNDHCKIIAIVWHCSFCSLCNSDLL